MFGCLVLGAWCLVLCWVPSAWCLVLCRVLGAGCYQLPANRRLPAADCLLAAAVCLLLADCQYNSTLMPDEISLRTIRRPPVRGAKTITADICVSAPASAGVSAALEAARLGRRSCSSTPRPRSAARRSDRSSARSSAFTPTARAVPDHARHRRRSDHGPDGRRLAPPPRRR